MKYGTYDTLSISCTLKLGFLINYNKLIIASLFPRILQITWHRAHMRRSRCAGRRAPGGQLRRQRRPGHGARRHGPRGAAHAIHPAVDAVADLGQAQGMQYPYILCTSHYTQNEIIGRYSFVSNS